MASISDRDRRALLVVGMIASMGFFLLAFLIQAGLGRPRSAGSVPLASHAPDPPLGASARESLARVAAESALAAKGWRQWLLLVRDRDRVEPMMREHHEVQGHGLFPEGTSLVRVADSGLSDRVACYALFRLPDGEVRPAAFIWSDGAFRFDWESWSAHGSMGWRDWLELRPDQEKEFRVYVESADDRPGILMPQVPAEWKRVTLVHRDSPESADAWLADESTAREVLALMSGGRRVPVTLRVRWESFGDREAAVVRSLVRPGWSP